MNNQTNVVIKNSQLQGFTELLFQMKLRGKASRMRSRFIRLLQERYQLIIQEIDDLQKEHAELDEDGEIKYNTIKMPDGTESKTFKVKDAIKFNQEIKELENELFVIEVNDERKEMIYSVRDSVLDCDMEFSEQEAMIYDSLCEVLEKIQ